MEDLSGMAPLELLRLHVRIADELRRRNITRNSSNPTGDLAEYIFWKAFGWTLTGHANPFIDALGPDGIRYQIKGRRVTLENKSRQLSTIRELTEAGFDFLAAVLFDHDYNILRAAIIPVDVVKRRATFVERTRSYTLLCRTKCGASPVSGT
jgi:hypothetical protein